jgi:hypothetical protein
VTLDHHWPSHWPPETANRVGVIARLKEGAAEQAKELLASGPPFDPGELGFERHTVYLSSEEVVFIFEGPSAARRLADMVDEMVSSESFAQWAPLIRGTPRIAHETFSWET